MPKKQKVKLSKKIIQEKYPQKRDVGEEVAQFATRLFLAMSLFAVIALSVDIYHFTN